MPTLNQIDLIVQDVPAAAAFFRDVVGLELTFSDPRFAELKSGNLALMLSPDALVPMQNANGVILHFAVENVAASVNKARAAGATVLLEPTKTDWGTESAMVAGPEGVVVDFYRTADEA